MAFNILIVDDSAIVRAVITKALKLAEVPINQLYQAGHGKEALAVLENDWVDLVFCDISMPVMDGEEFVSAMKENGMIDSIPVVIVSSAGSEPRVARLKENGVKDYIQKPFTPERIREVVDQTMGVIQDAE
ncbi:MAG: response regulator [Gemmatimonadales bacterium]|nr:response regulator [Gemmatimonadales bacterium]